MGIITVTTPFILNVSVNCYLVRIDNGFILIDTGMASKRGKIDTDLERAGCQPDNVALIVLTHGDFDHSGNAAYFQEKFGTQIAMHVDDAGMVERGDMLWNRSSQNILIRTAFKMLFRLDKSDRFRPDLYIDNGDNLSEFGFDAAVLSIPGHSKGSIGILTTSGDLFCGDLLANIDKPDIWSIIDDQVAAHTSIENLKRLAINTVYPGHGHPFLMDLFVKTH